ncbi:MAG: hypothetical protein OXB88_03745 [Bacteriovoracales bacterium]|nr:hypothetical protein [Bacteriovoracales bacterium]
MKIFIFILLSLFCKASLALSASDQKKREIIESLAEGFDGKKIFYRWQSKQSGDNLLAQGEFTDGLYKYFMGMEIDILTSAAGHGVYVSENPYDSAIFLPVKDEGSLIQVEVDRKGSYIDLEDSRTRRLLKKHKITDKDVFRLNPRVAVKYTSTWWALKGQEGVRFRPFTGRGLGTQGILNAYTVLAGEDDQAMKVFKDSLDRNRSFSANPVEIQELKKEALALLGLDKDLSQNLIDDWIVRVIASDSHFAPRAPSRLAKMVLKTEWNKILKLNLTYGQEKRLLSFLKNDTTRRLELIEERLLRTRDPGEFLSWLEFVFKGRKAGDIRWLITNKTLQLFLRLNPSPSQMERAQKMIGGDRIKRVFLEHKLVSAKSSDEFLSLAKKPIFPFDRFSNHSLILGDVIPGVKVLDAFLALNPNDKQIEKLLRLVPSDHADIIVYLVEKTHRVGPFVSLLTALSKTDKGRITESRILSNSLRNKARKLARVESPSLSSRRKAILQRALEPFHIDLWPGEKPPGPLFQSSTKMLNCLKKNLWAFP